MKHPDDEKDEQREREPGDLDDCPDCMSVVDCRDCYKNKPMKDEKEEVTMRILVKDLYAILQEQMNEHNGDVPVECVQEGKNKTLHFQIVNYEERCRSAFVGDPQYVGLPVFVLEMRRGYNLPEGGTP